MHHLPLTADPRPLGKSGIMVSPIAWGMWRFGNSTPDNGRRLIEAAFAAGVTLFDTADIYGFDGSAGFGDAEALLGKVLDEAPALREQMVLATKGGIVPSVPYSSMHDYLMTALENSLRRLRVDHVDLYQIHRPDILTHPAEVANTLDVMVNSGKVRAVGVSNYTLAQIQALQTFLVTPLASIQPEFSLLQLEPITNGLLDYAMAQDISVLAWSPLGGGRIGEPNDGRSRAVAAALDKVAEKVGVSRASAALSWIMEHPARPIPIAGTQKVARIAELVDPATVVWSRETWYAVLVAARGEKLP